jgi:hypothetical protein
VSVEGIKHEAIVSVPDVSAWCIEKASVIWHKEKRKAEGLGRRQADQMPVKDALPSSLALTNGLVGAIVLQRVLEDW